MLGVPRGDSRIVGGKGFSKVIVCDGLRRQRRARDFCDGGVRAAWRERREGNQDDDAADQRGDHCIDGDQEDGLLASHKNSNFSVPTARILVVSSSSVKRGSKRQ